MYPSCDAYSAELSLTKKTVFLLELCTEKNMELRCVQTQINIILKKIISIYYLDFDRSSREAPAGPDGPPVRICLWANQQTYINAVNLAFSSS